MNEFEIWNVTLPDICNIFQSNILSQHVGKKSEGLLVTLPNRLSSRLKIALIPLKRRDTPNISVLIM